MSRRKKSPRTRYGSWVSGMYAAVLLVLLVAVILFTRHYSDRLAGAYIDATLPVAVEDETATDHVVVDHDIRDARRIVRRAVDDAQRAAIGAIVD